jgi:transcriptional regulator with XRE-family HTH domain
MGRAARLKPARLGEKLLRIRKTLGLSQDGMVERLGVLGTLTSASISAYELGQREPPLLVLLRYAELANVHLEVLADDRLGLPGEVSSTKKHRGLKNARKVSGKKVSKQRR